MELKLFTHEKTLGEEIANTLVSRIYSEFNVVVAYLRNSGIKRIYNELNTFTQNGGKTSLIAGIDQCNTSYQALINIKTFVNENLFIHHDKNFDVTFHPKIYMFGNNENIEKVIIGSSNFTAGGFVLNYEANVGVTLDCSNNAQNFRKQVFSYWTNLLKDQNTKKCESTLLDFLLEKEMIADECKQEPFRKIITKIIDDSPFKNQKIKRLSKIDITQNTRLPRLKQIVFAMTLSNFDVSQRSLDPVILIPIKALKNNPNFWHFPNFYTYSDAGYPQLYAIANILIDGTILKNQHIRIYYYDQKSEFRLQCESIKRNGKPGDIVTIQKDHNKPMEFEIKLIRQLTPKYNNISKLLTEKVSEQKSFAYYFP
jgi:HKD family nuclease